MTRVYIFNEKNILKSYSYGIHKYKTTLAYTLCDRIDMGGRSLIFTLSD